MSNTRDKTSEPTPARRCIPIFKPHRWSRWRVIEGTSRSVFGMAGATTFQTRSCVRCGRTQVEDV